MPASEDGGHAGHGADGGGVLYPGALPLEKVPAAARPAIRDCPPGECDLKILLPKDHEGVYTVVTAPRHDPAAAQTLHVDQYSGRVLVSYGWEEYGILAKAGGAGGGAARGPPVRDGQPAGGLGGVDGVEAPPGGPPGRAGPAGGQARRVRSDGDHGGCSRWRV